MISPSRPPRQAEAGSVIATLDETTKRLAPPPGEPSKARNVREPARTLSRIWLIELPDGPAKDEALDLLEKATERAVAAVAG